MIRYYRTLAVMFIIKKKYNIQQNNDFCVRGVLHTGQQEVIYRGRRQREQQTKVLCSTLFFLFTVTDGNACQS